MKLHKCRSGRAKWIAIAAGTKGQRTLTIIERWLVDRKQILMKCHGCIPPRPLSPSGLIPLVTLCPLWLKPGIGTWWAGFSPCCSTEFDTPISCSCTPVWILAPCFPRNFPNILRPNVRLPGVGELRAESVGVITQGGSSSAGLLPKVICRRCW